MDSTQKLRPAVRDLIGSLEFRAAEAAHGRLCYLMRTTHDAGLVVPVLSSSYDFLRAFRRATVDEALKLGLIVLGEELRDMPPYCYGGTRWGFKTCGLKGRTISLALIRCTRCPDTDGPFTDAGLCEACARPMPLAGAM